ncbi:MAG: LysR family transcriptional regulator [Polyangiales bacterium]
MAEQAHWDLFRTFEAVARTRTITAAARSLGISQSTASRHLARLEELAGCALFVRENPLRLTQRGEALFATLGPMVDAALAATTALETQQDPRGVVTVTTVNEVVRWVLAKRLAQFAAQFPHILLRVLADNRVSSLARGEADIAVRLVRPTEGELSVKRLYTERYGYFVARTVSVTREIAWIGLTGSLAEIPEQKHAERAFAPRVARLLVEDTEALAIATCAGLGVAILPKSLAGRYAELVEVAPEHVGANTNEAIPNRDFWLVVHRSKRRVAKVRAVMQWIEQAFA